MHFLKTTIALLFSISFVISAQSKKRKPVPTRPLQHVIRDAKFLPSPVKTANDWQYGRTNSTTPNGAGMYALLAGNAACEGNPKYNLDWNNLHSWKDSNSVAKWKMDRIPFSTIYDVHVLYKSRSTTKVKIKVGGRTLSETVKSSGEFQKVKIGDVKMSRGMPNTLEMSLESGFSSFELQGVEVVPQKSQHRWFDTSNLTWTRRVPKDLRYNDRIPDQMPPAHLIKGGPKGYAVITTEKIKKNSKVLDKFIVHKKKRGFKTYIITEKQFGGGKGPDAGDNIRKWLHENYKKMDLLYVLFIGKPHPDSGDVPMMATNTDMKEFRYKIAQGDHPHAGIATDMFYMDCSGAKVDFDGDGTYGSRGDFNPEGGLDNVWDVLVGRIPYYGEDSVHGKYADVDAVLQKTINYENATFDEVLERYNFEVDGVILGGYEVEWGGFNYVTREQTGRGHLPFDHYSWQNNSFMDQYSIGFIRSGGHASPTFIESGVNSGWLANRSVPKDTLNVVSVFGGCDCSQPEHPMNMGYMHLRKGAIATQGASRSVAGVNGYGPAVRPNAFTFGAFRRNLLIRGYSTGQAHWIELSNGRRFPNGGAKMFTLYGDPSVVPFPQDLRPKRDVVVRPTHTLQVHEPSAVAKDAPYYKQEYDIQNLSGKKMKWKVQSQASWLSLRGKSSGVIEPGRIKTIHTILNPRSRMLPVGTHTATLKINIGSKVIYRSIEYVKFTEKVAYSKIFGDGKGRGYNPATAQEDMKSLMELVSGTDDEKKKARKKIKHEFASKATVLSRDVHLFKAMDSTGKLEIKPLENYQGNPEIVTGICFKLYIDSKSQTLCVDWEPYDYGEQEWNKCYINMSKEPEDCIQLRGKNPIKKNQWNTVAVSIDYVNKRAALYLNGKLEASSKIKGYYYGFVKMKMNTKLNAEFNSFKVVRKTTSPQEAMLDYKFGEAVNSPIPESHSVGENRQPTFRWNSSSSLRGIKSPSYRVFLSTDPKKLGTKPTLLTATAKTEFAIKKPLKGSQRYYWRVDAVSSDKSRKRTGNVWQFTTNKFISEEVLTATNFKDTKSWKGSAHITSEGVAEFKNNGNYIKQDLNKSKMISGAYKISMDVNCGEQKPSRPMLFTIHGDSEVLVSKTIELNDIKEGKLIDYFFLKKKVGIYSKLYFKLALPGSGGRSGYWVFMKNFSIMNAIDPRSVPNKAPVFKQQRYELPPMKAKDNSYAYFFAKDVTDENPKTVRFQMVEGPSWVTIQASGRVFSYYGAPTSAIGKHRIVVEARDSRGQTSRAFVTIEVK